MMALLGLIAAGIAVIGGAGAYLYFNGRVLASRGLDVFLEYQARRKGGFYRVINPNSQCMACGAKNGEISYNPIDQIVVHTCHICEAQWPELPRVPVLAWDFVGRNLKLAGTKKADMLE